MTSTIGQFTTPTEAHNTFDSEPNEGNFTLEETARIGVWLFIASEVFLFAAIISVRFYYWKEAPLPEHLNQELGLIVTAILLASSYTAYRAETLAAHGDRAGFQRNALLTISLGLVFMIGVGMEWAEAFADFPVSTTYGTIFLTTTGFHAFHVLTGLLALLFAVLQGDRITPDRHAWAEGAVKYWHFVDIVWVVVYPSLYLLT